MSTKQKRPIPLPLTEFTGDGQNQINDASCTLDLEGHCITCSDEALMARVLRINDLTGLASVTIAGKPEEAEVDISLLDEVKPGDLILLHGGVAIGTDATNPLNEATHE